MDPQSVARAYELQSRACERLDAPTYARLLKHLAGDAADGGPFATVASRWQGDAVAEALALKVLGALHDLALAGDAPALAAHYPSCGGQPRWPELWEDAHATLVEHFAFVRDALDRGVQTNEVGRCAVLLGGFALVAGEFGLPLRCFELGASAGLNLAWHRFGYRLESAEWGNPRARVTVRSRWRGQAPPLPETIAVSATAGCDVAPIDVTDDDALRRLKAFVWPDQAERHALLDAAVAEALAEPPDLERSSAARWLARRLADKADEVATVVYHSIFWQYVDRAEQREIAALLERHGRAATRARPLAWLRMELADDSRTELALTLWPTGDERRLARAHPHGRAVRWYGRVRNGGGFVVV